MKKLDKIYYWANNISKNSGEGILALNFLKLLKKKIKKQYYLNLINLKKRKFFFIIMFFHFGGVARIWKCYLEGRKVCYLNYFSPIWNFLLVLLPKETIMGPITGTNTKKKFNLYFFKKNWNYNFKKKKKKNTILA